MKLRLTLLLGLIAVVAFAENVVITNPQTQPVTMRVVGFAKGPTPAGSPVGTATPTATATATTPPPLADGNPVSTWLDSSGTGHTATQTGTARPTFKTNILNGKPVVRFTSAASSVLNIASPLSGAHPWTCLAVAKGNAGAAMSSLGGSGTVSNLPFGPFTSGSILYSGDDKGYVNTGLLPVEAAFHLVSVVMDATDALYLDGNVQVPFPTAGANTGTLSTIGARPTAPSYSDGDIAEIIFYNVALSATDRANVEKYLGTKYGITVAGGSAVQPDTVAGLVAWWKADSLGP